MVKRLPLILVRLMDCCRLPSNKVLQKGDVVLFVTQVPTAPHGVLKQGYMLGVVVTSSGQFVTVIDMTEQQQVVYTRDTVLLEHSSVQ